MDEVGLCPVGDAEVEMTAVGAFEERGGAQILIVACLIDIGPEHTRGVGHPAFAREIRAALDEGRGEAAIEPEQGWLGGGALHQPVEHVAARPDMVGANQPWSIAAARLGDRNALVSAPFGP